MKLEGKALVVAMIIAMLFCIGMLAYFGFQYYDEIMQFIGR